MTLGRVLRPVFGAVLAAVCAIAVTGCGSGEGSKDSDTVKKPAAEAEVLEEFSSPDLGLWHLTGPVSGASFLSYEVADSTAMPAAGDPAGLDSITFNRSGLVTSLVNGVVEKGYLEYFSDLRLKYSDDGTFVSGEDAVASEHGNKMIVKLSRSSGGYLQMLQVLGSDGELSNSDAYHRLIEWSNGMIFYDELEQAGEGTVRVRYHYNDGGFPAKVVSTLADMGGDIRIEEEYNYTAFDKYGNWLKRRVVASTEVTEGEADGTNMKSKHSVSYRVDVRRIYYYPPRSRQPE